MPTPIPNPLFLPFWYLSSHDDSECPLCEFRASDFADAPQPQILPVGQASQATGNEFFGGILSFRASDRPGGTEITATSNGSVVRRVRVRWSSKPTGAGGGPSVVPRAVVLDYFSEEGELVQEVTYTFEKLWLNRGGDPSIFTISWEGLHQLYDSELSRFAH